MIVEESATEMMGMVYDETSITDSEFCSVGRSGFGSFGGACTGVV